MCVTQWNMIVCVGWWGYSNCVCAKKRHIILFAPRHPVRFMMPALFPDRITRWAAGSRPHNGKRRDFIEKEFIASINLIEAYISKRALTIGWLFSANQMKRMKHTIAVEHACCCAVFLICYTMNSGNSFNRISRKIDAITARIGFVFSQIVLNW